MDGFNSSYLCIIVDNEKRQLYDILDTRSKEPLSLYFSGFPREQRLNVKYVTIDMWEPYKDVVKVYFPNCIVAVDPFHVIKHLTTGFDNLRISLMKQCIYDSNGKNFVTRYHNRGSILERSATQCQGIFFDNHKK